MDLYVYLLSIQQEEHDPISSLLCLWGNHVELFIFWQGLQKKLASVIWYLDTNLLQRFLISFLALGVYTKSAIKCVHV